MINRKGSTTVTAIVSIAAALGVGIGGYALMNGDCSSCTTEATTASLVAAETEKDGCCPLMTETAEATLVSAETESCESACSGDAKLVAAEGTCEGKVCPETGNVIAASLETEKSCESACSGDAKLVAAEGECEGKVCPMTGNVIAASLETEESCESACSGDAKLVAAEGECEGKVCPETGNVIAASLETADECCEGVTADECCGTDACAEEECPLTANAGSDSTDGNG